MPRLNTGFLAPVPFTGVPLLLMDVGANAASPSTGLVADKIWEGIRSHSGEATTAFLGISNPQRWRQDRTNLVNALPLGSRALGGCDSWCLWFPGTGAPVLAEDIDLCGNSFHLVFLGIEDGEISEQARHWKSVTAHSRGCLVFGVPELTSPVLVKDGLSALVISAWKSFCESPDSGIRGGFFGQANADENGSLWIGLGVASYDWGRSAQEELLSRKISAALRSAWLSPWNEAVRLPAFKSPGELLHEILPRPELSSAEPDLTETATLVTLGAHEYALHLNLPAPETPMRRWYLPRQIWREHLRRLLRLRFLADLSHLPQLQRLLDIRLERLPNWFEIPIREALAPLPDSPAGFLQAVKARLEAGRTLIRPWVESSVARHGDAATDAHSEEIARRISTMPSMAGGIARALTILVALLWVGLWNGVFMRPFDAWQGEWGAVAWSSAILASLALTGGVAWFVVDRTHSLWRAFHRLAVAIPLRVTDHVGSRLIAAIVSHTRSLDEALQRDKETLEEKGKVVAGLAVVPSPDSIQDSDITDGKNSHVPVDWHERAFPTSDLHPWVVEAHGIFVDQVGGLQGLLDLEPEVFVAAWDSATATAADLAFATLSFEEVAKSARWENPHRDEIVRRAIQASLSAFPAEVHPIRCLVTVPESWRGHADRFAAVFHPHDLRVPELVAVSLVPISGAVNP